MSKVLYRLGFVLLIATVLICPPFAITTAYASPAQVTRLCGQDRFETGSAIVSNGFEAGSTEGAILVTGSKFPDALAASALAGVYHAPILLSEHDSLSKATERELERLGTKVVYVLGGENSVPEVVINQLKAKGIVTERISGTTRQYTASQIMREVNSLVSVDTVVITTGQSYADSLTISPYAYAYKAPIILSNSKGELMPSSVTAIKTAPSVKNIVIVGGSASVSNKVLEQLGTEDYHYTRLAGDNRYATAKEVAKWELQQGMTSSYCAVANGESFPDALTGSAHIGQHKGILLLSSAERGLSDYRLGASEACTELFVYGGENSVPASCLNSFNIEDSDTEDLANSGTSETADSYVISKSTMKFHYPECRYAQKIKEENRQLMHTTREALITQGYEPCGTCKP